jgi:tetratricopeptide (TPR) repeat protein
VSPFSALLVCAGSEPVNQPRAALNAGRREEAAELLAQLPFDQRGAEDHLVAGTLLVEGGQPELGLAAFEAGFVAQPLPELALNICIVRSGLEQGALEACQRAIELAPTEASAFLYLGHAASAEGSDEAALAAFERACQLALEPDLELGRACLLAGRRERAEELLAGVDSAEARSLLFRVAVDEAEASPQGPARSLALARAHRWERALASEAGVGLSTDRGRLLLLEGERLEAERHWELALEQGPEAAAPRIDLARSWLERGRREQALELLREGAGVEDLSQLAVLHELLSQEPDPAAAEGAVAACRELGDDDCARAFVTLLGQP